MKFESSTEVDLVKLGFEHGRLHAEASALGGYCIIAAFIFGIYCLAIYYFVHCEREREHHRRRYAYTPQVPAQAREGANENGESVSEPQASNSFRRRREDRRDLQVGEWAL